MYITYEQLFSFSEAKGMKVLAGKAGMYRLIRSAHNADQPDVWNWVGRGELVFEFGSVLTRPEEELVEILEKCGQKQIAGLVISIGPYIKKVPEELTGLSDELEIPLLSIPWETHVKDVLTRIYRELFFKSENLRSMQFLMEQVICAENPEEYTDKLALFGYQAKAAHIVVHGEVKSEKGGHEEECGEGSAYAGSELQSLCEAARISCLHRSNNGTVIAILELDKIPEWEKKVYKLLKECVRRFKEAYRDCYIQIGISNPYYGDRQLKNALQEAWKALTIVRICHKKNEIRCYSMIGAYQLFFSLDDAKLNDIVDNTLGPLIAADKNPDSNLLETLEVYLDQNCHIGNTAEVLFIHRNTLKYRINKVCEILGCDLTDVHVCFNLRLAYKIRKYLSYRQE